MNGISTNRNLAAIVSCLRQSGVKFAFRYYSRTTKNTEKRLTPVEALALSSAGIMLGVVYEDNPTSPEYFSLERGQLDASSASAYAAQLGQPAGSAIYFSVDYDADSSATEGPIHEYFLGIERGLRDGGGQYEVGVYGSGAVCVWLKQHCPFVAYTWLAESRGWRGSTDFVVWDVKQSVAGVPLCGLTIDDYETCYAQSEFGGFTTKA
jgi:hypothetical protein